jgi:hypothetical protein
VSAFEDICVCTIKTIRFDAANVNVFVDDCPCWSHSCFSNFTLAAIMFRGTIMSRMLARTPVARAISPYAVFLKDTKALFLGLPIGERGQRLAKVWKAMPLAQKASIRARAQKIKAFKPRLIYRKTADGRRLAKRFKRDTKFGPFYRANAKKVAKLPSWKRLGAMRKLYSATKTKKTVSKK